MKYTAGVWLTFWVGAFASGAATAGPIHDSRLTAVDAADKPGAVVRAQGPVRAGYVELEADLLPGMDDLFAAHGDRFMGGSAVNAAASVAGGVAQAAVPSGEPPALDGSLASFAADGSLASAPVFGDFGFDSPVSAPVPPGVAATTESISVQSDGGSLGISIALAAVGLVAFFIWRRKKKLQARAARLRRRRRRHRRRHSSSH